MGQRLCVQIYQGGRVLASAFYQWGAYTKRALDLTAQIVHAHDGRRPTAETDLVLYAIQLLESTGATLAKDELTHAKQQFGADVGFKEGQSMDQGLIAFTPNEMQQMEDADEGRVELYLDTHEIIFDVCGAYDKDVYIEYYLEDEENAEEIFEELPIKDMDLARFSFMEAEEMASFVGRLSREGVDKYRLSDGTVITIIS